MKDVPSALRTLAAPLVDFALPARCPACGIVVEDDDRFCLACWQALDHLDAGCAQCGDPAIAGRDTGELCGACLSNPPAYDTMRAAVAYGDVARDIALRLKYGGRIGLARLIAKSMARNVVGIEDSVLMPVPLHRGRIWKRGYNQAALIARALSNGDNRRLRLDTIVRTRATPYLRGMTAKERHKTVRGVFAVPQDKRNALKGMKVILVDDVYTTGSTVKACASVLKRHGAAEVHVRCWARVSQDEAPAY